MSQYEEFREIFVKTVCGEGDENVAESRCFRPEHAPTQVLGTRITEHEFHPEACNDGILVKGTYQVNIWYSYNKGKDTALLTVPVNYEDLIPVNNSDCTRSDVTDVRAWNTFGPKIIKAQIVGEDVIVSVSRTWHGELIGEAALCVRVYPDQCEDGKRDGDDSGDLYLESEDSDEEDFSADGDLEEAN